MQLDRAIPASVLMLVGLCVMWFTARPNAPWYFYAGFLLLLAYALSIPVIAYLKARPK